MEQKKVMDALSDVSVMVKKKLQIALTRMVHWFKIQSPYICIFGITQNQRVLVIAKTLKATYHLIKDIFLESIFLFVCFSVLGI
jgi:hypothetical protein